MYIIIRLLPYIAGILSLIGFELVIKDIHGFWYTSIIEVVFLIFSIFIITKNKLKFLEKTSFFLIPLLFYISSFAFLLFVEGNLLKHFFVLMVSYTLGLYLEKTLVYLWQPEKHKPRQLAILSIFFSIVTIFFTATSLFSLSVYIRFPVWILVVSLVILITLISGFNFWSNKIELKKGIEWRAVLIICFTQFFMLLNFWPISFYVKGILFASLYYLINLIAVKSTSQSLKPSMVWKNAIIVGLIWVALLSTARW